MMIRRGRLATGGGVVAVLLFVGYIRLPFAALASLADYDLLADEALIYTDASRLEVSTIQRWWIKRSLPNLAEGESVPKVSVRVKWNLLLLARVQSGHYMSPTGAEGRDCLYIWCLGVWIPAYDFSHEMA